MARFNGYAFLVNREILGENLLQTGHFGTIRLITSANAFSSKMATTRRIRFPIHHSRTHFGTSGKKVRDRREKATRLATLRKQD